ncbi:hypothetical protein KAR91_36865 [Candidatus Pacearchaeota archaeon]|nr:hypothetical protein [Candidatus Pacearchaeota archaeon]
MIVANKTRYGLDVKIYRIQQSLDKRLPDAAIYGQLYENDKPEGRVLEWSPKEKEVFVDDNKLTVIGFRVLSKSITHFAGTATLDCIMTTETTNREKTQQDIYKYFANSGFVNNITGIKTGLAAVFSGLYTETMKYRDVYPYHIFAFTIEVGYNYGICV